jgi:hypothetical protein
MIWWIVAAILLALAASKAWRAYKHPAHQLGMQAAKLGWRAAGSIKDPSGFRNTRLVRGNYESIILFREQEVRLTKPEAEYLFKDYDELEEWLSEYEREAQEEDPEILYYRAIDSYVRSVGYYEPLLELQGTDEEYCIAVMKTHKAAYLANVPAKIAGALTLDSVKHYYQNRDFALVFLGKLESKWLAESNAGASLASDSPGHASPEDADNFHPSLDKAVELVRNFFADGGGSNLADNPRTELVAYAATYIAMKKSDSEMPSGCWNTFRAAIENRMLSIADDGSQRSGTIQTPNGPAFAHFTSSYWAEMDTIEELANKAFASVSSSRELSAYLFRALGGNSEQERAFEKLFSGLVEFASRSIFPKVERVFG